MREQNDYNQPQFFAQIWSRNHLVKGATPTTTQMDEVAQRRQQGRFANSLDATQGNQAPQSRARKGLDSIDTADIWQILALPWTSEIKIESLPSFGFSPTLDVMSR